MGDLIYNYMLKASIEDFEPESNLCLLASMWTIELCIRCCDICKDLRFKIPAIHSRNMYIVLEIWEG